MITVEIEIKMTRLGQITSGRWAPVDPADLALRSTSTTGQGMSRIGPHKSTQVAMTWLKFGT